MTIDDARNALARAFGEPTTYDREGDYCLWWPRLDVTEDTRPCPPTDTPPNDASGDPPPRARSSG